MYMNVNMPGFGVFFNQVIYFTQNSSMWYLSHFSCERVFQQLHQVPWIYFLTVHFTLGCTIKEAEGFLHYVSDRKQNTLDLNDENYLQPVPHFTSWRVRTLDSSLADPKADQGSVSEKRRFKKLWAWSSSLSWSTLRQKKTEFSAPQQLIWVSSPFTVALPGK